MFTEPSLIMYEFCHDCSKYNRKNTGGGVCDQVYKGTNVTFYKWLSSECWPLYKYSSQEKYVSRKDLWSHFSKCADE